MRNGMMWKIGLVALLLTGAVETGAQDGHDGRRYEPAPITRLEPLSDEVIRNAVEHFKRQVHDDPPVTAIELEEQIAALGGQWDLCNNLATFAGADLLEGPLGKLRGAFERVGTALTVHSMIQAQITGGSTAGVQLLYESAKFLSSKVAGGWVTAGTGLIQYELETIGRYANRCVDENFYRYYVEYHLEGRDAADLLALVGNNAQGLASRLDAFWESDECTGLRGYSVLETQHTNDKEGYRAAFRRRFIDEYILPELAEYVASELEEAEGELVRAARAATGQRTVGSVTVDVPDLIDVGSGKYAANLTGRLVFCSNDIYYIVAENAQATGQSGLTFTFPLGRIIDSRSARLMENLTLELRSVAPAGLAYALSVMDLELSFDQAKVTRSGNSITLRFPGWKQVHMAYPLRVRLTGTGAQISQISCRVTALQSSAQAPEWTAAAEVGPEGWCEFPEPVPTGYAIFQAQGCRLGSAVLAGQRELAFPRPAQVAVDAAIALPDEPDLAGTLERVLRSIDSLADFSRQESKVQTELHEATGALLIRLREYEVKLEDTHAKLVDQRNRLTYSDLQADVRQRLTEANEQQREAAERLLRQIAPARQKLLDLYTSRYLEAKAAVEQGIDQLRSEYSEVASAHAKEIAVATDSRSKIAGAMRIVAEEYRYDRAMQGPVEYSQQKVDEVQTAARTAQAELARLHTAIGRANETARAVLAVAERLQSVDTRRDLSTPNFRPFYPGRPDKLQREQKFAVALDHVDAGGLVESAAARVQQRHQTRVRNEPEANELRGQIGMLGFQMPSPHLMAFMFDRKMFECQNRFAAAIRAPAGQREILMRELADDIHQFLDANRNLCGDLRAGDRRSETVFAQLAALRKRLMELLGEEAVFRTQGRFRVLDRSVWRRLDDAERLRRDSAGDLVAMENELDAASSSGMAAFVITANTQTQAVETLISQADKASETDLGAALATLDEALALTTDLPVALQREYETKIFEKAEALSADGAIERYARTSQRPLIVFDRYLVWPIGQSNAVTLGRPFLHLTIPPLTQSDWTVSIFARVEGAAADASPVLAVAASDTLRRAELQEDGTWELRVTLADDNPRPTILGGLGDATPLAYDCLRQVVLEQPK